MSYACPHCTKDIPGVLTQDDHEKRLKAKSEENTILKGQLTTANEKLAKVPDLEKTLAEHQGQLRGMQRSTALAKLGIVDDKAAKLFELVYDAEMSDKKPEELVEFGDFEKWVGDHPVLKPLMAKPGTTTTTTTQKPPPNPPPRVPGQSDPPPQTGKMTPAQTQAYFDSAAFKALSFEERRKKLAEMETEARAPASG